MGPNSSFLLLISMIILSCHMAYVFLKSKGRILVNQMTNILMKGMSQTVSLYTLFFTLHLPTNNTSLIIRLGEVYGERSNRMCF